MYPSNLLSLLSYYIYDDPTPNSNIHTYDMQCNKPLQTVKRARHLGFKLCSFNPIVTALANSMKP